MRTPHRRRTRRLGAAAAVGAAALALAGCGGTPSAQADAMVGEGLFVSGCGTCHTLEAAGTMGVIGPNLDDAFRGARQQGWEASQVHAVTREWIELAEPPMPRDIFTGEEAENVSAYVASVAGMSEESVVRAPTPPPPLAPVGAEAPEPPGAGGGEPAPAPPEAGGDGG